MNIFARKLYTSAYELISLVVSFVVVYVNCIKSELSGAAIKLKDLFYKSIKRAFFLLLLVVKFVVIYMRYIAFYRSEFFQKILMLVVYSRARAVRKHGLLSKKCLRSNKCQ